MHTQGPWIDRAEAVDAAKRGVLEHGLDSDPNVAIGIQTGYSGTPLLVERLDKPEGAYYLVPWIVEEGVVFVARVDASKGTMLETTIFPKATPSPFLTPETALTQAARKFPHYEFGKARLVWCPCRESTSPIRPFYQIPFDKGVLYVDMDGSILLELTPLGFGGEGSP